MKSIEFENLIGSNERALVKFSAKWCGPCKAMEPILEEMESEKDFPKVLRIDVEEAPSLSEQYNVRAIPTLMLIQKGEVLKTQVGLQTKDQLQAFVS